MVWDSLTFDLKRSEITVRGLCEGQCTDTIILVVCVFFNIITVFVIRFIYFYVIAL